MHIALQILLKGALPITAAGGAIGGTVYAFTASSSNEDLNELEDVLKNIDFATADKEFLKEKAKELAEKLELKKDLLKSLSTELEDATKEKDLLEKSIKEDVTKVASLDEVIDAALAEKQTNEQKQTEIKQRKAQVDKKHHNNQNVLNNKKTLISATTQEVVTHKAYVEQYKKEIAVSKLKIAALGKEIKEKQTYYDALAGYAGCWAVGNWGCTALGWWLNREDRAGNAAGAQAILNKRLPILLEKRGIQAADEAKLEVTKTYLSNSQGELTNKENILTQAEKDKVPLQEAFDASLKELELIQQELTPVEQAITKAQTTIDTKTKDKDPLVKQLETSRATLAQKTTLIETKTPELTKHQQELERLTSISEKILQHHPDMQDLSLAINKDQ